jgi:flagellar biosynthesis/type III secretory pathway protein FliH
LLTRQTKGDDGQRLAAKWRLAKLLYERNWDKQRIIDLFSVIDWMMQVPPELQRQLWQDIEQLERNRTMPYITSVERIGIEKGMQQGVQQGVQQGMQLGETALLERLLTRRFGPLSDETRARLASASLDQLGEWADNILDAQSLDAVFTNH